jgi:hypothetical protein
VSAELGRPAGEPWCTDEHEGLAPTSSALWPAGPEWAQVTAAVLFGLTDLPGEHLSAELLQQLAQPAAHREQQRTRQAEVLERLRQHLVAHPDAIKGAAWMAHHIAFEGLTVFPTATGLTVSVEMWERLPLPFCTPELQQDFAEQGMEVELRSVPQALPTPGSHHFNARMQKYLVELSDGDVKYEEGPKPKPAVHQFRDLDLGDLDQLQTRTARAALRCLILQHGRFRLVWSYENRWMVRTIAGKDAGSVRMAATYPLA